MFLSLAKRKTGKGNSEIFERMENSWLIWNIKRKYYEKRLGLLIALLRLGSMTAYSSQREQEGSMDTESS